jgi:flagellar motor switch/type III secretory pathway protein FliN
MVLPRFKNWRSFLDLIREACFQQTAASSNTLKVNPRLTLPDPKWHNISSCAIAWQRLIGNVWSRSISRAIDDNQTVEAKLSLSLAETRLSRQAIGPLGPARTHWPALEVSLGGNGVTVLLEPRSQWVEIQHPNFASLSPDLQVAITSHLTKDFRFWLGSAMHYFGVTSNETSALCLAPPDNSSLSFDRRQVWLKLEIQQADLSNPVTLALIDVSDLPIPVRIPMSNSSQLDFRLMLDLRVGETSLFLREIESLEIADVVIFEKLIAPKKLGAGPCDFWGYVAVEQEPVGYVQIRFGEAMNLAAFFCSWDQPEVGNFQAIQTRLPKYEGDKVNDINKQAQTVPNNRHNQDRAEVKFSSLLEQIPVRVEVVLVSAPQRISDVQRWVNGSVIPLQLSVGDRSVELRANGFVLAKGRIVSLESSLGFEVLEINSAI